MSQLLWLTLLAAQATLAGVWWWLMPHGFASSSSAFWVNEVAPPILVVLCALAVLPPRRLSAALFPALTASLLALWMALAISARLAFPRSVGFSWNVTFLACCALGALWWKQLRPRLSAPWLVPVLVLPALLLGWAFPGTQRAPDPTTTPHGAAIVDLPKKIDSRLVKLGKTVQLHPSEARLVWKRDKLLLTVEPLLTFLDRSPERTWVGMSEPEDTKPTARKLLATQLEKARWQLEYKDEDRSLVDVTQQDGAVTIDARSRLSEPVFSRVNTWAELTVRGHKKLYVSFSPVPGQRLEVPGALDPARFAYLDAAGLFHVAEAHERKSGPYRELASGKLEGPLVVTLYDGDTAAFRVALDDWAAQASTALSPTSGLPQNAIELAHAPGGDDAPAYVVFSLASTSLGRTSQTVGHAAGVYRNRMTVTTP